MSESCQRWAADDFFNAPLFCVCIFLSLSSTTRAVFADKIVLTRVLPDCALRGGKVRDEDRSQHTKEWAISIVDESQWEKWRLG